MPRMANDPRATREWRRLTKRVAAEEPICHLALPGCTTVSVGGDHIVPVSERPDLALDRANVRGACEHCNKARRNQPIDHLAPIAEQLRRKIVHALGYSLEEVAAPKAPRLRQCDCGEILTKDHGRGARRCPPCRRNAYAQFRIEQRNRYRLRAGIPVDSPLIKSGRPRST